MAEAPDSLESLLSCQVCFEEFEEDGDHVPRILPCHHTLCQTCIAEMIARNRQDKIVCPECRAVHEAKNQTKSFPQNKYLVIQAKRKTVAEGEVPTPVDLCPEHGKELVFFCRDSRCQKPICPKCLTKHHKKHDFVDIEEENKDSLLRNTNSLKKGLKAKIATVSLVRKEIEKKTEACINKLKTTQNDVSKQFDKMIKEAEDEAKEAGIRIDDEITAMNKNFILLDNIEQDIEINTNEDIVDKLKTVNVLSESINQHLSELKTYVYPEHAENQTTVETFCGTITWKVINVELQPDQATTADQPVSPSLGKRSITDASQLNCRVIRTVDTRFNRFHVSSLTLLPNGNLFACGEENGVWKFKVYNPRTGREVSSVTLENVHEDMAAVTLGGRNTVALSYRFFGKIEFRDVTDLHWIVFSYSVAPHEPGILCTAGSSTLLYEDVSENPREVKFLDCSAAEPKPTKKITCTQPGWIKDMHCIEKGHDQLLVTAREKGLYAYNTETDQLEWRVEGIMPGMEEEMCPQTLSSDRRGLLFVCDNKNPLLKTGNNCIQRISVDGRYLGPLLREGEQGLGRATFIRWNEMTSSLIVGHWKGGTLNLSTINVE